MENILIPDIEKIARVTAKTIDRFANFAEAIFVTEEGRSCVENVSKVCLCRTIMLELGTTKTDFDGLFDILQNVILTLVTDTCSGCCRTNETKIPNLTRIQKYALRKSVTFDKLLVKELDNQVKNLQQLVKKHKNFLTNDEKYRREVDKYEKKLAVLVYQLHGSTPMKTRLLYFLQMKRDRALKGLNRAKSAYRINADLERSVRTQIKNVSDDLTCIVTDKIIDRLEYGMEYCLYDVISRMNERENRMKAVEWVKHLNLRDMSDRLVSLCSETYAMRVNVQPDYNANAELTLEDVSSYNGSVDESAGSGSDPTVVEEIAIDNSTGEISTSYPACGGKFCRKVGFCTGEESYKFNKGICKRTMTEAKVRVKRDADRRTPGFIDVKPGMVIRQTYTGQNENEVGFGYCRPRRWGRKQWGFYFVKPTQ
ncbi:uncharacterized protein LOC110458934 isoform X1 [Mizuhopecten yessoensis]|uniref:uncharacterized protein LOC110458934 isoform X1 n=1 Tax=Mizuhopecten yessoensis TaxID=6573 RepID=UPI000B45CDDE|nr:uncharacterized protein LOC110458934 isoform X1 [Mizuhopecten yessoensis]